MILWVPQSIFFWKFGLGGGEGVYFILFKNGVGLLLGTIHLAVGGRRFWSMVSYVQHFRNG